MKARTRKVLAASLAILATASMLSAAPKTVSKIDPITRMNDRTPEELMDLTVKTLEFVERTRKSPELAKQVAAMQKRPPASKGDSRRNGEILRHFMAMLLPCSGE